MAYFTNTAREVERTRTRDELKDREDELLLDNAEKQVAHFWRTCDANMPLADRLTHPEVRHHVQTILDLTPTKRL